MNSLVPAVRVDQWLWAARFYKTRSLARAAVENGRVLLNGQRAKPAKIVKVGDTVAVSRGEERMEVAVEALSVVRGSATVAQALYRESDESRVAREATAERRRLTREHENRPESRPDRRARRALRDLKESDEG